MLSSGTIVAPVPFVLVSSTQTFAIVHPSMKPTRESCCVGVLRQ
jgi:hypothetical protein